MQSSSDRAGIIENYSLISQKHGKEFLMDRIDRKILALLQEDAALSVAEVAERVGLSTTPCWRRIRALETAGVIRARVALLDPKKLNLNVPSYLLGGTLEGGQTQ